MAKSKITKTKDPEFEDISSYSDKHKKIQFHFTSKKVKRILITCAKVLVSLILVLAITGSIAVTALTVYVMKFVEPEEDLDIKNAGIGYATTIVATDESGKETEIATLHSPNSTREWVDLKNVPEIVRKAFVASEDKRFYDHDGVDWGRTFSAFANLFLNFYDTHQGGSTITQQLVKNVTGDKDVSPLRKITEIFRAVNLEKVYSKDQILEGYLNIIPFTGTIQGIQVASKYYFGKDTSQLTLVEGAALAAMVRAPNTYSPLTEDGAAANKERRNNYVLQVMYDEGYITADELQTARDTDLVTVNRSGESVSEAVGQAQTVKPYNSWFVDAVIEEVINDLVADKKWTSEYAEQQLYNGGYKIYTTEDPAVQTALENRFKENSTFFSGKSSTIQASMVIMDYNGNIKGLVGSRGAKEGDRLFNLATMADRRPGSSIKPIAVYGPAVEANLINYSSVMDDTPFPTVIDGVQRTDWPQNFDHVYQGNVLLPEAIRRSKNTVAVKLLNQLNPQTGYDFLTQKLGFTTLVKMSENGATDISLAPLALGALSKGATVEEMTAAFQIFGDQGVYTEGHTYTKVLDNSGNVVLEKNAAVNRALSPETATIMNRLLLQVVEGQGGTGAAAKMSGWTTIGKTGTATNDDGNTTDQWFIGCNPYYVAGIWTGNVDSSPIKSGSVYSPGAIWKKVMTDVMKGKAAKDFTLSDDVIQLPYCTDTGQLATSACPHQAMGYYKSGNLPDYCTLHK